jgi:hypothetical protein
LAYDIWPNILYNPVPPVAGRRSIYPAEYRYLFSCRTNVIFCCNNFVKVLFNLRGIDKAERVRQLVQVYIRLYDRFFVFTGKLWILIDFGSANLFIPDSDLPTCFVFFICFVFFTRTGIYRYYSIRYEISKVSKVCLIILYIS